MRGQRDRGGGGRAALARALVAARDGECAHGDVRVGGAAGEDGGVERAAGRVVHERGEVEGVRAERVRGRARDADLVLAAGVQAAGVVGEFGEEVQAGLGRARARRGAGLDHRRQSLDLGGDRGELGGEDGVELAQVGVRPGELERERVERVGVLGEERERVGGVHRARGRCGRRRGRSAVGGHRWGGLSSGDGRGRSSSLTVGLQIRRMAQGLASCVTGLFPRIQSQTWLHQCLQ